MTEPAPRAPAKSVHGGPFRAAPAPEHGQNAPMDDRGGTLRPDPRPDPLPGLRRGAAGWPAEELRERVLGGWDALLALAADREAAGQGIGPLAELGSWPERPVLARLLAQARSSLLAEATAAGPAAGPATAPQPPRRDHSGDDPRRILDALSEARERVSAALDETAARPALGLAEPDSALGPLPLLTQIHAMGHELALAALRLPDAGPPGASVPGPVTDAGVAALVDVVGALARRQGLRVAAGVWGAGTRGWVFRADAGGWTTSALPPGGAPDVPGIEGAAATVLAVPAGRAAVPALIARGELRLHRIGGLMALAPLVEQVPGLPGGALLRRAVGVVGLLGRLPGMR